MFGGHDRKNDEYFACYDIETVGWGARAHADGNSATDSINGNCRVMPVEVFETRYPWLTEVYRLRTDSGGAGRQRGGLGTEKIYRCLDAEITASQLTDRHQHQAYGLDGGLPGATGMTRFKAASKDQWQTMVEAFAKRSTSKWSNVTFHPGDRVQIETPGGGGYGPPRSRERAQVAQDLAEGFISAEAAQRDYGFKA